MSIQNTDSVTFFQQKRNVHIHVTLQKVDYFSSTAPRISQTI